MPLNAPELVALLLLLPPVEKLLPLLLLLLLVLLLPAVSDCDSRCNLSMDSKCMNGLLCKEGAVLLVLELMMLLAMDL